MPLQLYGVSVRPLNAVYQRIRVHLARGCAARSPFPGALEAVSPASEPGASGASAEVARAAKPSSLAWLEGECVHTEIVPNASKTTLQASIRGKVDPNGVIHAAGGDDDGLLDPGLGKRFRASHGNEEFVKGSRHVNGIASFRSDARRRLAQCHGIQGDRFGLPLKEAGFRLNHRLLDLYGTLV